VNFLNAIKNIRCLKRFYLSVLLQITLTVYVFIEISNRKEHTTNIMHCHFSWGYLLSVKVECTLEYPCADYPVCLLSVHDKVANN
jgi:hypothetical protein